MNQQRQHGQQKQKQPTFTIAIEVSWVSNLTIGRNVYVRWKYSPLEHGKTQMSTVGINERADFLASDNEEDNDNDDDDVVEEVNETKKKKKENEKKKKKEKSTSIELKNKKKFREISFELREVDERGRSHDLGHAFLCLSNLVGKTLERQVLLELDADPKKSSTLLINKRPILCLQVKVSRN